MKFTHRRPGDTLILGVESSCDETAFAVVRGDGTVLSNTIASQVELHARYGGVVPEIASRAHLEACVPLYHRSLADAGISMEQVDAIAVTKGPGLLGCLLIGVEFAKTLAFTHEKPLVGVQHVAGHVYSPWLRTDRNAWGQPENRWEPYVALVASGGHSSIILARSPLDLVTLGETIDDAVGEAYDKIGKLLGLPYPGGPAIDRIAAQGNPSAFRFPLPMLDREGFDFSFSGLKTAVARTIEQEGGPKALAPGRLADICASFQHAAVRILGEKCRRAVSEARLTRLAITGGVACNRGLREALGGMIPGVTIAFPRPEFCTDNAAMIAGLGYHALAAGLRDDLDMNADPSLPVNAGSATPG